MNQVTIYTDGGCWPNPGPGGWGAVLIYGDTRRELYGASVNATTNNRMEITAALSALQELKEPCFVTLWTDSQYLIVGAANGCPAWERNGWKRKRQGGAPIANVDLWVRLAAAMKGHKILWQWLKSHSGHEENERCDYLASLRENMPNL